MRCSEVLPLIVSWLLKTRAPADCCCNYWLTVLSFFMILIFFLWTLLCWESWCLRRPRLTQTAIIFIQTNKRFKRTLFIRIKHNMRILGAIPFIKLQNDTLTQQLNGEKRWKMRCRAKTLIYFWLSFVVFRVQCLEAIPSFCPLFRFTRTVDEVYHHALGNRGSSFSSFGRG